MEDQPLTKVPIENPEVRYEQNVEFEFKDEGFSIIFNLSTNLVIAQKYAEEEEDDSQVILEMDGEPMFEEAIELFNSYNLTMAEYLKLKAVAMEN